jgi:hypothetical protein
MDRIIDEMNCPVTYACVQNDTDPGQWQRLLDYANYTPSAPEAIISRVHELPDIDGMIRDFQTSEAA